MGNSCTACGACVRSNRVSPVDDKDIEIGRLRGERAELEAGHEETRREAEELRLEKTGLEQLYEELRRERGQLEKERSNLQKTQSQLRHEIRSSTEQQESLKLRVERLAAQDKVMKARIQKTKDLVMIVRISKVIELILRNCFTYDDDDFRYNNQPPQLVKLIEKIDVSRDIKHRMHFIRIRRNRLVHDHNCDELQQFESNTVIEYWLAICEEFRRRNVSHNYLHEMDKISKDINS